MSKNFLLSTLFAAAAIGFATVPAAAEDLAFTSDSASQSISENKTTYQNVSVADGVTGTISFGANNKNLLVETSVSIGTGSTLEIKQDTCDLISISGLTGTGTLTLSKASPNTWGGATVINGDGSGFTGTINVWNGATATNGDAYSQGLHLNSENAAKNATIALGNYSSLIISAVATTVAGLNSTNANAKVTSNACSWSVDINNGNPYNNQGPTAFQQNDGTARTLTISGSGTYSYSGDFGSSANSTSLNLVKSGTGTQTFSGAFYAGTVSVTAGTLALHGATTVDSVSVNGGALDVGAGISATNVTLTAGSVILSNLAATNGVGFTVTGTVSAEDAVMFDVRGLASGTYTIATGGTLTFTGLDSTNFTVSGRQTISSVDAGTSQFVISATAYSLQWAGTSSDWNTSTENKNWTVLSGGTVEAASEFANGDSVTFGATGAGTVTVASAGVSAGTMTVSGGDYTFTGGAITARTLDVSTDGNTTFENVISAGTLTKTGTGTVLFSSNLGTTNLVVNGGTVKIGNSDGSEHAAISIGSVTVGNGGTFDVNGTKDTVFAITLNAGSKLTNTGAEVGSSKMQTPNITLGGDATVGGTNNFGVIRQSYGGSSLTLNSHTLTKVDNNTWMLANTTISAGTVKIDAGTVEISHGGNSSAATFNVGENGTLKFSDSIDNVGALSGTGTVEVANNVVATVTGGLKSGTLVKTGEGTLKISENSNSVSGANLTINTGTVELAAGGIDGALRGSIVVNEGAELKLSAGDATGWGGNCVSGLQILGGTLNITTTGGSGQNQTFNNLAIKLTGGTITGVSGSSFDFFGGSSSVETFASTETSTISNGLVCIRQDAGATFTVADGDAEIDLLVSAKVSNTNSGSNYGAHSLIKEGAGTMSLTGANDYSGATQINAGTLVAGNNSAFGTGTVSVASGAKLQIAGGVKLSGVSGVTLADGAKLVVDLSEKTSETETFVIDLISSTAISVAGANLTAGDVTGTMTGKYELLGWDKTGWVESWSYANNTLSLTMTAAIPEPSLFGVLAGLGALALVGTRRRRRK